MTKFAPKPITLAVIGAGNRGAGVYAHYALQHPTAARVVAVAEPRRERRAAFAAAHRIPADRVFSDWRELLAGPRRADALIIATPDRLHVEPALAALRRGYDVLLEKPIAPTEAELRRLSRAAADAPGTVTVAHVLRYTPFFTKLKQLLDAGRIGRLQTIQFTENISYWHFAHSFVRGNWRRADTSSPMILAKSCHDLDLLRWLAGAPCRQVASFGDLNYFRSENAPPGAPARCTDGCPVAATCPFDAVAFYVDGLAGHDGWPVSTISADSSRAGRLRALREGPYGRCVFRSDNDVVDNQVGIFQFANGVTATLNVSAFTEENTRTLKLMGSGGEIRGHLEKGRLEVRRFGAPRLVTDGEGAVERVGTVRSSPPYEVISVAAGVGHAGGDEGLMAAFIRRVDGRRRGFAADPMPTSLAESLDSHFMAFAAERARLEQTVVLSQDEGHPRGRPGVD